MRHKRPSLDDIEELIIEAAVGRRERTQNQYY